MAIRIINFAHIGTRSAKQIEISRAAPKYSRQGRHTRHAKDLLEPGTCNLAQVRGHIYGHIQR